MISKEIKQAKNQQKMNTRLEKKRLLMTEQDKLKQDCDDLMKLIADNEPCDSDDSNWIVNRNPLVWSGVTELAEEFRLLNSTG